MLATGDKGLAEAETAGTMSSRGVGAGVVSLSSS